MPAQPSPQNPTTRMTLSAIGQIDHYSRLFRRQLRDAAIQLVEQSAAPGPVTAESVEQALRSACEELLALAATHHVPREASHAQKSQAA